MTEDERAAAEGVLPEGCTSISAAELGADLHVGTTRDRVIAFMDGGGTLDGVAGLVRRTLKDGVRPTARVGSTGRAKILAVEVETGERKCRTCERALPTSSFKRQAGSLGGFQSRCRSCEAWKMRKERYGLDRTEIVALFACQQGRCGACARTFVTPASRRREAALACWSGEPPPYSFHVDHDHASAGGVPRDRTRGLLCNTCNQALQDDLLGVGVQVWALSARRWLTRAPPLQWAPEPPLPSRWGTPPLHGPEAYKEWRHYGLTWGDKARMLADQQGRCGICQREFEGRARVEVDHEHRVGAAPEGAGAATYRRALVRGLLCGTCNSALGRLQHSPEVLDGAVAYLAAPPARRLWPPS